MPTLATSRRCNLCPGSCGEPSASHALSNSDFWEASSSKHQLKSLIYLVGALRFELGTPSPPDCAAPSSASVIGSPDRRRPSKMRRSRPSSTPSASASALRRLQIFENHGTARPLIPAGYHGESLRPE